MTLRILFTLVLLVIVTTLASVSGSCTLQEVKECLAPLKEVKYDVAAAVVPYLEKEELKDHCKRYDQFELCMETVRPYCSLTDRLVYQGIEDAYNWMCKDGFEEYLRHRECFKNENLHQEGKTCNGTFTTSLNNIKQSTKTTAYKRKRICQYVMQYLSCVEAVIISFCDADAAKWQRTMDEKSLEPLVSRIGCSLNGNSFQAHWIPITIGIMLTISIIIIIMSIVLVFMQRRKRRLAGCVTATQPVPGAPPPYDGPGPYLVYNGTGVNMTPVHMAATGVQQPAGPIPEKRPIEAMQPPPYVPHNVSAQAQEARNDVEEDITAGYFGATGVDISEDGDKKNLAAGAEMSSSDVANKDIVRSPAYEAIRTSGLTNPTYDDLQALGTSGYPSYDDVEALGYFGTSSTTPSKQP